MADVKFADESHTISDRREIWMNAGSKKVTLYNLAYINHNLFAGDNGGVVGYDNVHDGPDCHYFGVVESMEVDNFEDVE